MQSIILRVATFAVSNKDIGLINLTQMKKTFYTILLCLFVSASAMAQMSLNDCMIYARDHAADNRRQELSYRAAQENRRSAYYNYLPSVGASVSGQINYGRSIDPETNVYATRSTAHNGYSLSLSLPLFTGLANFNNVRMSRAIERQNRSLVQANQDKVSHAVMQAYYSCVYYRKTLEQMQEQLEASQLSLKQGQVKLSMGAVSQADVAQLEANVAGDEYAVVEQQNRYDLSLLELKATMNWPLDSLLEVDATLSEPDPTEIILPDEEVLLLQALASLPEVKAAQEALKGSRYALKSTISGFLPSLSFSAGYSTSYYVDLKDKAGYAPFHRQLDINGGEYLGLSLSVPIFNRLSNVQSYRKSKLSYKMQQLEYEQTLYTVESEIRQAVLDLHGAHKEYISAHRRLKAVELAHKANVRRYEQGVLSPLELKSSSSQLAEAKAIAIGKSIQILIKERQIEYYEGRPFIR